MIKGVHSMFYSSHPEQLKKFLAEVLEMKSFNIGNNWLVFDVPHAEMGVHPTDPQESQGAPDGTHDISFFTDDIESTVAKLKSKNVELKGEIEDHGYGLVVYFQIPGNHWIQLFQPKYKTNFNS